MDTFPGPEHGGSLATTSLCFNGFILLRSVMFRFGRFGCFVILSRDYRGAPGIPWIWAGLPSFLFFL